MKALEPFVGTWETRMVFPTDAYPDMRGTARFEWILDGAFLLETSTVDHPVAPNAHIVFAPDRDAYRQHYFDARGVVRDYAMTFDGRVWTSARYPDPPEFHQRFSGELDGDEIRGAWERVEDGVWRHDFDMTFTRVG